LNRKTDVSSVQQYSEFRAVINTTRTTGQLVVSYVTGLLDDMHNGVDYVNKGFDTRLSVVFL